MIGRRTNSEERTPAAPSRGIVRGAVIGFITVGIGVTLLAMWAGHELPQAAAMGLMVAVWGGTGFGAMVGGTIAFLRAEDRERAAGEAATGS